MSKRILLVDDDERMLPLLALQISELDYQVDTCKHPGEALGMWWSAPDCYSAVITDYAMFPKNGTELAKAMRVLWCTVPIILISAGGDSFMRDALDKAGITDFLSKPFDKVTLGMELKKLLA